MNIVDLIVFVIVVIFVLIFYRLGLWAILKSFISLFLAVVIATLILGASLNFLSSLGWYENVFTPLVVYPLIIIFVWGIVMAILNQILPNHASVGLSIASIPVSILFGLLVCMVLYLITPQFLGSVAIALADKSAFAKIANNIGAFKNYQNRFLKPISSEMAKSVILSGDANEILNLEINPKRIISSELLADNLFDLINNSRQTSSLEPLRRDPRLDQFASSYANEILKTKRFSHLDTNGSDPQKRAKDFKVQFNYLGENLALAPTMEAAHYGLMDSISHRANIQSPVFRKIGIAVLDIDNSSKLIVEELSN